jgi:hypothetical protein
MKGYLNADSELEYFLKKTAEKKKNDNQFFNRINEGFNLFTENIPVPNEEMEM